MSWLFVATLVTPSLGLLTSTLALSEPTSMSLLAGVALTAIGIRLTIERQFR